MSEYQKLNDLLSCYEKILHPDVFIPIMKQVSETYNELKAEAYKNAKISDDALWIEQEIIRLKETYKHTQGNKSAEMFYVKCFYKALIKRFIK